MRNLKCLIVDDEPPARLVIESYLARIEHIELVGSAKNAIEAFNSLKKNAVDLILLDINMPEVSGIGLLKMLTVPPVVILTTAYSEYALESYEYNVADYLLKPVRFERFEKAIAKARALRLSQVVVGENKFSGDSFEFRMDGKVHRVPFHDILFLQSLGNYVRLFTERKTYLILKTTRETEEQLPRSDFVRTHKSFIVNINKMRGYDQHFVMINDHKLPIGKIYKRNFLEQKNRFH